MLTQTGSPVLTRGSVPREVPSVSVSEHDAALSTHCAEVM